MNTPKNGLIKSTPAYVTTVIVMIILLFISVIAAVTFGTVKIPFMDVYRVFVQKFIGADGSEYASGRLYDVVWLIRMPRMVLAIGVGMALSICGLVMQAVVKNPLADPYIMGISSGAYAGVTAALLLGLGTHLGRHFVGIMGFAGAFGSSLLVVFIANIGGRANSVKLILTGTAVSALCGSFSNFVVFITGDSSTRLRELMTWNMGSLARATWSINAVVLSVAVSGLFFFLSQYRRLNLMLLGDDAAITLGADLHKWRILYLLVSAMMVGFSVFSAGMIGFVGLVIPHISRLFFGTDHKKLIPICGLSGAIFLLWADVLCRIVIKGAEMPIGILTSIVGAPCFIYLMVRRKYKFGGQD